MQTNNHYIWVTRPGQRGQQLTAELHNLGYKSYWQPSLAIESPNDITALHAAIKNLANYDIVIFISPSCIEKVLLLCEELGVSFPSKIKTAVMGSGGAALLEQAQLPVSIFPEDFSAEGLLQHPELQQVQGKRIALLRGDWGRENIAPVLIERGALLDDVICYQRATPQLNSQQQAELDRNFSAITLVIVTSCDSLRNLMALLNSQQQQQLKAKQLLVVSKRIADLAAELGLADNLQLAANASNQAIIEAINML